MGSVFEEVGLTWKGREYIVPPDQVMGLIDAIEEVATFEELSAQAGLKRAKLARAYSAALRYAGVKVKFLGASVDENGRTYNRYDLDEEIYADLFGGDAMATTTTAVRTLLQMMIPPERLRIEQQRPAQGKKKRPRKKKTAKGSSRKVTS